MGFLFRNVKDFMHISLMETRRNSFLDSKILA